MVVVLFLSNKKTHAANFIFVPRLLKKGGHFIFFALCRFHLPIGAQNIGDLGFSSFLLANLRFRSRARMNLHRITLNIPPPLILERTRCFKQFFIKLVCMVLLGL